MCITYCFFLLHYHLSILLQIIAVTVVVLRMLHNTRARCLPCYAYQFYMHICLHAPAHYHEHHDLYMIANGFTLLLTCIQSICILTLYDDVRRDMYTLLIYIYIYIYVFIPYECASLCSAAICVSAYAGASTYIRTVAVASTVRGTRCMCRHA